MQKITPHLWFDKEAKQAAAFYTSIFKNSAIKGAATLHDTPSGTCDLVTIELAGQEFRLISAGPLFKFTPAVSFVVACDTKAEVAALWRELSKEGTVLMPLDQYRSARDMDGQRIDTASRGK
jgi:predicted 3-demethylubiquinone-9 3-methyltransferase (glyoxalase superfamily)